MMSMKHLSTNNNILKIIVGCCFLLLAFVLAFIKFGGGDFKSFGEIFALVLGISFVMMFVPAGVYLANHKGLDRKRGLKICITNSIVIFVLVAIWPIITIIKNEPCDYFNSVCAIQLSWDILSASFILVIFYCIINICFWVDLHIKK